MTLIEGIGDEVTHFFIGLLIVSVVSLAWWTTNITEQRQFHTVWLLDRRRHHRLRRRFTNHTHTVTISEATSNTVSTSEPETAAVVTETTTTSTMPKPPEEPSTSNTPSNPEDNHHESVVNDAVTEEQNQIVQVMDDDACIVRQRRLEFYNKDTDNIEGRSDNMIATNNATSSTSDQQTTHADIRIRLKYINDDLRLVDGNLQEKLGDFKKRHFQGELTSDKLVRLIFNGQVLQQDTRSLESCGLFDNCVVHCLIQQKRPTSANNDDTTNANNRNNNNNNTISSRNNNQNINNNSNNNNNQGRDWDLGNFLFALITFTLLSAWYFRYVYAHLYTVTATVGLILMTGVFSIVLFGFYFPEQEHIPG